MENKELLRKKISLLFEENLNEWRLCSSNTQSSIFLVNNIFKDA